MILKKCNGCGSILQDTEPDKPGFIPKLTTTSEYCQRCFRMKHYNELPKIVASNSDYEKVIDDVMDKNGLVIFIVDLFSFKSTFNKKMIEKLRKKDVILVANKYDLLPKSTNPASVVDWLSKECEKFSFKVIAIHLISAKKGYFIDDLIMNIENFRRGRDVYFVGCANVGKSSLINSIIRRMTPKTEDVISTSIIPGTTLNEIRLLFFDDGKYLIDTPGLINEGDILNRLLPKSYEKILPKNEIKPITYQIKTGNTVLLAGLASLSFECEEDISVIVYVSKDLYIQRSKTANLEHLVKTQTGKLLNPPVEEELSKIFYAHKKVSLDGLKKKSIWFAGFGFVSVIGKCEIDIRYIDKSEVYVTNAII